MAVAQRRRRIAIAAALLAFTLIVASAAGWFALRPAPADVARRFEERVAARFPGTRTVWLADDFARVALPSGVMLDVALTHASAACRSRPPGCADQLERLTSAIERVTKLAQQPRADAVRAVIVAEPAPGYLYGYLTEPLIGPLEIRYAQADGDALTFMTPAMADRLGVKPAALRELAVRHMERETANAAQAGIDALTGEPGVHVARSTGDAPALLLSPPRMKAIAGALGTQRLYCAVPRRGLLLLAGADAAGRDALQRAIAHSAPSGRIALEGVLVYDGAAPPASALSGLN